MCIWIVDAWLLTILQWCCLWSRLSLDWCSWKPLWWLLFRSRCMWILPTVFCFCLVLVFIFWVYFLRLWFCIRCFLESAVCCYFLFAIFQMIIGRCSFYCTSNLSYSTKSRPFMEPGNWPSYTGLFEKIVGVLTTCYTKYTWDSSICIFLFNRTTLQVFVTCLTGALYVQPLWFYKH